MKNLTTKGLTNKKMSPEVYKLRRNVIDLIYEAKQAIPSLPRIEVRITEKDSEVNGVARVAGKIIWIPENSAKRTKK